MACFLKGRLPELGVTPGPGYGGVDMHSICFSEAKCQRHIQSGLLGAFWSAAWTLWCATYLSHFGAQTKIYGKLGLQ